jgi:hypothetical protein
MNLPAPDSDREARRHPVGPPGEAWVRETLEPEQLAKAPPRFGRASLSRGTVLLLWALRIYVVLMTCLVGLQIWRALHADG